MKRKLLLAAAVTASLLNTGLKASDQQPKATSWRETMSDKFSDGWESAKGYASDYGSRAGKGLFGYGMKADPLGSDAGRFKRVMGSKPAKMARTSAASLIGLAGGVGAVGDVWSSAKNRFSFIGYKFAKTVMRYSDEEAMAFAQKPSTKVIAPVLSIILPYLMQSAIRPGKSYMRQGGEWVGEKVKSFRASDASSTSAAPAASASANAGSTPASQTDEI